MTDVTQPSRIYVVEHLDPELEEWSTLEYTTIAQECAAANVRFVLSNVPIQQELPDALRNVQSLEVRQQSVDELFEDGKNRVCLLDPGSIEEPTELDLSPEDTNNFDVFLFGGIKGDHFYENEGPDDSEYDKHAKISLDRTSLLRHKGYTRRKLGDMQMTTDTAVRVARLIIQSQMKLDDINFVDFPECKINQHESIEMPFRYVVDKNGNPIMPDGMLDVLEKDAEQGIDDLL